MNTIAIIPAKANSSRLPNKNMLDFCGRPLFAWSVEAALDAGLKPVVYTDNRDIIAACRDIRAHIVLRKENDGEEMEDAVRSVLKKVEADRFVVLQPTSPLRVPGLIAEGWDMLKSAGKESGYTCQDVKPIGHIGNSFQRTGRTEITNQFLKWHDGNIIWCTRKFFEKNKTFMTKDSLPIQNVYPATLQIDYQRELDGLASIARKKKFRAFLPGVVKNVAIVTNKNRFDRNYSKFIDSCDIVIRLNKLDNIDTGTAGSITDIAIVRNSGAYFMYSEADRHVNKFRDIPLVWLCHKDRPEQNAEFLKKTAMNGGVLIYTAVSNKNSYYTTYAAAVQYALQSWSRCHIYGIGTFAIETRTTDGWCFHKSSNENVMLEELINEGKFTIVDEENVDDSASSNLKYST